MYCFFLTLVFLEIIELNCFGLSYMTKKNIELRAQLDVGLNIDDNDEKSNAEIPLEGYIFKLENNSELILADSNSSNEE